MMGRCIRGRGVLNDGTLHPGTGGVHTHMTNSRLTDPEVLEWRFPVLVGGDGTRRRTRFLEAMTLAVLSGHRIIAPPGLAGGDPGAVGRSWVEQQNGARQDLASADKAEVAAGDVFVLETPSGGGYGPA